jgi:D-arabinose 1-dehydrogenase-like Zn-dependent alcohol dehydrogenase
LGIPENLTLQPMSLVAHAVRCWRDATSAVCAKRRRWSIAVASLELVPNIALRNITTALERLRRNDVMYRFVIDLSK